MPAKLLSQDQIHTLHTLVIGARLDRKSLLGTLPADFVASLPDAPSHSSQILSDLDELDGVILQDGTIPLLVWLRRAVHLAGSKSQGADIQRMLDLAESMAGVSRAPVMQASKASSSPLGPPLGSLLQSVPFQWTHPNAIKLRSLLVNAYANIESTRHLALSAGVDLGQWVHTHGIEPAWNSLLEVAAKQGKLVALIERVLNDPQTSAYHTAIRALRP